MTLQHQSRIIFILSCFECSPTSLQISNKYVPNDWMLPHSACEISLSLYSYNWHFRSHIVANTNSYKHNNYNDNKAYSQLYSMIVFHLTSSPELFIIMIIMNKIVHCKQSSIYYLFHFILSVVAHHTAKKARVRR